MDYHIRRINRETAGGIVPENMFELAGTENPLAAIASEGEMLAGLVLLSGLTAGNAKPRIIYIGVAPEFSGMGLEENMLNFLAQNLSAEGTPDIRAYIRDDEKAAETDAKLQAAGFSKSDEFGKWVGYKVADLKKSELMMKLDSVDPILANIKYTIQLTEEEAGAFEKEMKQNGRVFDKDLLDPLYGQFYVENSRILGYTDIRVLNDERLIYRVDSYMSEQSKSAQITLAMLASFLSIESWEEDEWEFYLPVYSEAEYKGLITSFGQPATDMGISIYRRRM